MITIVLTFVVLGCDAWASLNGKIMDETGNPVSDAKIMIEQGNSKIAEEKSQPDGSYKIHKNVSPTSFSDIKMTVSKEGYQNYEKILSKKEVTNSEINITLKKN